MENKSLLDKIKKLINKADSAKEIGSLAEADVFLGKVNELLVEHNLSMSDMDSHELDMKDSNKVVESGFDDGITFGDIKTDGTWEIDLFNAIAHHYMCDMVWRKHGRTIENSKGKKVTAGLATIIGTVENVEAVKFIYGYVRDLLRSMSRTAHKDEVAKHKEKYTVTTGEGDGIVYAASQIFTTLQFDDPNAFLKAQAIEWKHHISKVIVKVKGKQDTWTIRSPEALGLLAYREPYLRAYLVGAVRSVRNTLWKIEIERNRNKQMYGIVLVNKEKIQEFVAAAHADATPDSRKKPQALDPNAYNRGRKEGDAVNINSGIEAGEENPIRGNLSD